jgi:hypothetical protein
MHVGHGRHMRMDDGQAGNIVQLAQRLRVDIVGKNMHGHMGAAQCLMNGHNGIPWYCRYAGVLVNRRVSLTGVLKDTGSGSAMRRPRASCTGLVVVLAASLLEHGFLSLSG